MRKLLIIIYVLLVPVAAFAASVSSETQSCLRCHKGLTPGIVADWESSRHSRTTPEEALKNPAIQRRISAGEVDEKLRGNVVGCYECHGLNADKHKDNFSHFGFSTNIVVSPNDCATCHPVETEQYAGSKKANAIGNLTKNPVYHGLVNSIIGPKEVEGTTIKASDPSDFTRQDACFACHGTVIEVKGMKTVKARLSTKVPELTNWPNQGVGRINPDGSMGACTPCHARHAFSIEVARKPHTCAQCHLEPDVPAWNVYAASKHGNIYLSDNHKWDFEAVPWKLGTDFKAPTCATCHVSLVTTPDGGTIAERTHDFGGRLWVRLFGLIYTHPQPKSGDTSIIRNADGLPLPTTFLGEPALEYLIDPAQQRTRQDMMESVCKGCHSTYWVTRHFDKLKSTIEETDSMTLQATKLVTEAWNLGLADNENPFDEAIELKWVKQWLFYGNNARYASAMTGAQDYVAVKDGWWGLTTNLQEMKDKIDMKKALKEEKED